MWILQRLLLLSSTGDKKWTEAGDVEGMDTWQVDEVKWRKWMEKECVLEGNLWEKK